MHYSYEGEGPYLGIKTAFMSWSPGTDRVVLDRQVGGVYITSPLLSDRRSWDEFVGWYFGQQDQFMGLKLTVECPLMGFSIEHHCRLPGLRFVTTALKHTLPVDPHIYVKVRVLKRDRLKNRIVVANHYAQQGHRVLLMPEWRMSGSEYGQLLMDYWDVIDSRVRFMPPVQHLLEID